MLPRIHAHMKKAPYPSPTDSGTGQGGAAMNRSKATGSWGQFFPVNLSPFGYNETTAQEYLPLTQAEAEKRGFRWSPEVLRITGKETSGAPEQIENVSESFAKEVLACEACKKNYKVAAQEIAFLKSSRYPFPRTCPECRHRERLATRNPRKLWKRNCAKCGTDIATTFAPNRPEIVYCERCYLEAVY